MYCLLKSVFVDMRKKATQRVEADVRAQFYDWQRKVESVDDAVRAYKRTFAPAYDVAKQSRYITPYELFKRAIVSEPISLECSVDDVESVMSEAFYYPERNKSHIIEGVMIISDGARPHHFVRVPKINNWSAFDRWAVLVDIKTDRVYVYNQRVGEEACLLYDMSADELEAYAHKDLEAVKAEEAKCEALCGIFEDMYKDMVNKVLKEKLFDVIADRALSIGGVNLEDCVKTCLIGLKPDEADILDAYNHGRRA